MSNIVKLSKGVKNSKEVKLNQSRRLKGPWRPRELEKGQVRPKKVKGANGSRKMLKEVKKSKDIQ